MVDEALEEGLDRFHDEVTRIGGKLVAPFLQDLYRIYDEIRARTLAEMAEIIAKRLGHERSHSSLDNCESVG